MRGTSDKGPIVRGRHSTLYPVELPCWLPGDVLEAILREFREFAQVQVQTMIERFRGPEQSRLVRSPSRESTSATSTHSNVVTLHPHRTLQVFRESRPKVEKAMPDKPQKKRSMLEEAANYFRTLRFSKRKQ